MSHKLHEHRKSYQKGMLTKDQAAADPVAQFGLWFEQVTQASGIEEVNAMTLSTVDQQGYPRGRVVLLKHFDVRGFQFFTNYVRNRIFMLDWNCLYLQFCTSLLCSKS